MAFQHPVRWLAYMISRFLLKLILGMVTKTHVLHRERTRLAGGWLFVSNHISHFDPPFLAVAALRKLDWMATRELYHPWPVALWMHAVDTFPVDRERADRAATRETLDRLKRGRVVGIFPEGGIRDGANSVLEGAPLKPGVAGLTQLSGAPVVPCVLIGSDQLYTHRNWIPLRRIEAWIAFGEPLHFEGEGKERARRFETRITEALRSLYAELKERFHLTETQIPLPQPPARRKGRPMSWRRLTARALDTAMCALMYAIQRRHRLDAESRDALTRYIDNCAILSRDEYYYHAPAEIIASHGSGPNTLTWASPVASGYAENDRAFALHFPAPGNASAPTVLFLHALMSASDWGYRRWAAHFNAAGWSACFVHLPYHYSRIPRGYRNGELAITADLARNAQGLRQGVTELRQLMAWLRGKGVSEFGLWACSYGGWIGALLASVERDFRFVALIEPIVNVDHAIWHSPTGIALRRELHRIGVEPELPARHFPLTSPMHGMPLCSAERILLAAGEYDTIARAVDICALQALWPGASMIVQPQGHFGYHLMPAAWEWLRAKGWLC